MKNRIREHFKTAHGPTLNMYCTAGFPAAGDTLAVLHALQEGGADMAEIGIPFSDPTADGETIQWSSRQALDQGMTLKKLFSDLEGMRPSIEIPVLLMGYLNPALQFGFRRFLDRCADIGVDGLILPDLPIREYEEMYRKDFEDRGLSAVFLVTPQTSEARIRAIDELSNGFVYAVSTYSITGARTAFGPGQIAYFERLRSMHLRNPWLIGFGISDRAGYETACRYADGAIIGSAYIQALREGRNIRETTRTFIRQIRS